MLVINFKTYESGTGPRAVELARICNDLSKSTGKKIVIAVQPFDLKEISSIVDIPVFAQHLDPITPGANTGWLLPEAAKLAGASGTLINHSERKLSLNEIEKVINRCKELNLTTIVCAATPEEAEKIDDFHPDYIAVEPPELIGTGIPVSKARPEVITSTLERVKTPVLCGAGITNGDDVRRAVELGAVGVLVASAIVKSTNPREKIIDMLNAFKV